MSRAFAIAGGLLFVGSLLYFAVSYGWRFTGGGEWSWRDGLTPALANAALFSLFALHHSIFARTRLKETVQRLAAPGLERPIYIWLASLLFVLVCAAWQPVPGVLWHVTGPAAWLLQAVQLVAALLTVASARRLDMLALAGVRQFIAADQRPATPILDDRGPYGWVRHPIYLGWFVLVWCAPLMNGTRALFAAVSCFYLVLAIPFEERDLRRTFGDAYGQYAARVRWKVIPFVY
jgi:protein-S-isoprenylcysteine O-methyltransferase Ste14